MEDEFIYILEYMDLQFYDNCWLCFTICVNFFCSFSNLNVYNKLICERRSYISPGKRGTVTVVRILISS